MDRRKFFTVVAGLVVVTTASDLSTLKHQAVPALPKKFGSFDVAEDGTMTLQGQQFFPTYTAGSGVATKWMSYKLHPLDIVEAIEHDKKPY